MESALGGEFFSRFCNFEVRKKFKKIKIWWNKSKLNKILNLIKMYSKISKCVQKIQNLMKNSKFDQKVQNLNKNFKICSKMLKISLKKLDFSQCTPPPNFKAVPFIQKIWNKFFFRHWKEKPQKRRKKLSSEKEIMKKEQNERLKRRKRTISLFI